MGGQRPAPGARDGEAARPAVHHAEPGRPPPRLDAVTSVGQERSGSGEAAAEGAW